MRFAYYAVAFLLLTMVFWYLFLQPGDNGVMQPEELESVLKEMADVRQYAPDGVLISRATPGVLAFLSLDGYLKFDKEMLEGNVSAISYLSIGDEVYQVPNGTKYKHVRSGWLTREVVLMEGEHRGKIVYVRAGVCKEGRD